MGGLGSNKSVIAHMAYLLFNKFMEVKVLSSVTLIPLGLQLPYSRRGGRVHLEGSRPPRDQAGTCEAGSRVSL